MIGRAFVAGMLAALACSPVMAANSLFEPIYAVLTHPRCLNCHTKTDFPRQGDERRRHDQLVMRGPEDHGAPTLQCSACHQERNTEDGAVPGAPHWGLAPLSMAWEDLDARALCEVLKDRRLNGDRSLSELLDHMTADPLVLWGWAPGGVRTRPPLEHGAFVQALNQWIGQGALCE